jgi:hypothetical protein
VVVVFEAELLALLLSAESTDELGHDGALLVLAVHPYVQIDDVSRAVLLAESVIAVRGVAIARDLDLEIAVFSCADSKRVGLREVAARRFSFSIAKTRQ